MIIFIQVDNRSYSVNHIDPQNRQVEIYRPSQDIEVLTIHSQLSSEDILPSCILNSKHI